MFEFEEIPQYTKMKIELEKQTEQMLEEEETQEHSESESNLKPTKEEIQQMQKIETMELAEELVKSFRIKMERAKYYDYKFNTERSIKYKNKQETLLWEAGIIKEHAVNLLLDIYNDYMDLYNFFKDDIYKETTELAKSQLEFIAITEDVYRVRSRD